MKTFFKKWWRGLLYEPDDPRQYSGIDLKIVVIGGGTGLSTLLRGMKKYSNKITAIVSVMDNGKSSGTIRKEFDILPPGDIRKCISALAYDEELVSKLMEYRFKKGENSFSGHTLGNIWITALSEHFNSFEKAIEATTEIFETAGRVLPSTLQRADLCAEYENGETMCGESEIPQAGKKIKRIFLNKQGIKGYKKAVEAIKEAQIIILGPGSLYTSVIPNLLITDIRNAIRENAESLNVYICNCSTERGETENYSVENHIDAIFDHCKGKPFDYVLVNNKIVKSSKNASVLGNINNITTTRSELSNCKIISSDIVSDKNPLYHDPEKLAKAVIELYNEVRK